ncbi:hypothetical protein JYU34_007750 [Plutella xylostella]|uniref:Uncharacterized protein n=1 Tax=Plutella xylostella TaxID=51655 RepID=A0ABQ7QR91_PLUXY|nr:hypothetical protein JYU34_007750 [Plutella xylostella]
MKPSNYVRIKLTVTPNGAGPRQVDIKFTVLCRDENDEIIEIQPITTKIHTLCFNTALEDCRPHKPIDVDIYAPDLCIYSGNVHLIFVLGCVYRVPVAWNLRREKICDCAMVVVQTGISTFEKRHNCVHRDMVELSPLSGIVSVDNPGLLHLKFKYLEKGNHKLCYILTMPNDRTINLYVNIFAHSISKGILTPLRRLADTSEYLTILDCGRVPVNNLDPVVRLAWLYNPTDVFTTWRLLRGNSTDMGIRCMLHFAEVAPLGRLAIPFAFFPTEMIDYEVVFSCSFGYDIVQMVVRGQGGLPGCLETRLDLPSFTPQIIRNAWRNDVVHLSKESFVLPTMPTHCLSRDIVAICNDTDFTMRFIWLPERIANIVNVVMTPCWGVLQPRAKEWITMTVYTLQEPATFTTTVACEMLNLTARREYQQNETLRRVKMEKINQEFIITEKGLFYMTPPYDLLSSDINDMTAYSGGGHVNSNNLPMTDIIRIMDQIICVTSGICDAIVNKALFHVYNLHPKEDSKMKFVEL